MNLLSLNKDQWNDPRNHTKWTELNVSFVLVSCGFVDRISFFGAVLVGANN